MDKCVVSFFGFYWKPNIEVGCIGANVKGDLVNNKLKEFTLEKCVHAHELGHNVEEVGVRSHFVILQQCVFLTQAGVRNTIKSSYLQEIQIIFQNFEPAHVDYTSC